jgi:hypothetical protein
MLLVQQSLPWPILAPDPTRRYGLCGDGPPPAPANTAPPRLFHRDGNTPQAVAGR